MRFWRFTLTEEKHINKESTHRRNTLCSSKRRQAKVGLHQTKMSAEMPKREIRTCFASRRNERGHGINKKSTGRNGWKYLIYGREKGRRRWWCLGKPLRVYFHSTRRTYLQRSTKIKNKAYWMPSIQQYVLSMYAELTLAKICKKGKKKGSRRHQYCSTQGEQTNPWTSMK